MCKVYVLCAPQAQKKEYYCAQCETFWVSYSYPKVRAMCAVLSVGMLGRGKLVSLHA